MSAVFWRRCCGALALVCAVLAWRDCTRSADPDTTATARAGSSRAGTSDASFADAADSARARDARAAKLHAAADCTGANPSDGRSFYGFTAPAWAMNLAPQPGENMLAYRDRIVPIARTAIAPQRARVAHLRDDFATAAHLEPTQRAALDSATSEAADQIEEQVLGAVMNGDFSPQTFRPMAGVQLARQLLDDVDHADQKFRAALTADQRATLAQQHFDFADYLVFSTPWEQALGYTE